MNDPETPADLRTNGEKPATASRQPASPAAGEKKQRANMHEGIAVWCDCCCCEAEPYWEEVAAELGISLSDHEEDPDREAPGPEQPGS